MSNETDISSFVNLFHTKLNFSVSPPHLRGNPVSLETNSSTQNVVRITLTEILIFLNVLLLRCINNLLVNELLFYFSSLCKS